MDQTNIKKLLEIGNKIGGCRAAELLADPIWLLQEKAYVITDRDKYTETLKKEIWESMTDDEREDYGYNSWEDVDWSETYPDKLDNYSDCIEIVWELWGIFLSREDAVQNAEYNKHHFPYGYRTYSISLHNSPQLKALLRALYCGNIDIVVKDAQRTEKEEV